MQSGGSGALDSGTHKGGKALSHSVHLSTIRILFDRHKMKEQNTLVVVITFIYPPASEASRGVY